MVRKIHLTASQRAYRCTTESIHIKVERAVQVPGEMSYKLTVSGLRGGHSGECIGMERGNAVKLAARLLHELDRKYGIRLTSIIGGEKDNAIPRETEAVFVSAAPEKNIKESVATLDILFQKEFAAADSGLRIGLTCFTAPESGKMCPLTQDSSRSVIRMMYLLPTGARRRSVQIEGLIEVSENMASVRTNAEFIELHYSLRSAIDSCLTQMEEELRLTAEIFDAEFSTSYRYPAWPYNPKSFMRDKLAEAFREKTGKELILKAVHGGLECGVFAAIDEKMDIVTFGPRGIDAHTPNERLDLKSFDDCFEIFRCFLEKL